MNDCLKTTMATTADAGYMSPSKDHSGRRPPADTLAFMHPGLRRVPRANKSELKANKCFYLNKGRNYPRDSGKVLTSSSLTTDTLGVTGR